MMSSVIFSNMGFSHGISFKALDRAQSIFTLRDMDLPVLVRFGLGLEKEERRGKKNECAGRVD